jgi:hypothetical protein
MTAGWKNRPEIDIAKRGRRYFTEGIGISRKRDTAEDVREGDPVADD